MGLGSNACRNCGEEIEPNKHWCSDYCYRYDNGDWDED